MNTAALRMLDVTLNRAREALRLIEDYARFARDDAAAAARAKRLRHGLREIAAAAGPDALLAARDIVGDVGRDDTLPSETRRDTLDAVVRAAFGRLTEALREIAELAKLLAPAAVRHAEQLRYGAYELEASLLLRAELRGRLRAADLYVILTAELCRNPWEDTARAVLAAGVGCVQLREKGAPDRELLNRARRLRELTRAAGALLIINDRPDIARLVDADGVHLGQDDLSLADARRVVGGAALIGRSTHAPAELAAALEENPDYVAVGPMFASRTKPGLTPAGPALLAEAVRCTLLPIVAIGGIDATNVAALRAVGSVIPCVCSAVISTDDPAAAVRALRV